MLTDLSDAFLSYLRAAQTYKKAKDSCGPGDGYYLFHERNDLKNAEYSFVRSLIERIKQEKDDEAVASTGDED